MRRLLLLGLLVAAVLPALAPRAIAGIPDLDPDPATLTGPVSVEILVEQYPANSDSIRITIESEGRWTVTWDVEGRAVDKKTVRLDTVDSSGAVRYGHETLYPVIRRTPLIAPDSASASSRAGAGGTHWVTIDCTWSEETWLYLTIGPFEEIREAILEGFSFGFLLCENWEYLLDWDPPGGSMTLPELRDAVAAFLASRPQPATLGDLRPLPTTEVTECIDYKPVPFEFVARKEADGAQGISVEVLVDGVTLHSLRLNEVNTIEVPLEGYCTWSPTQT